MTQPLPQVAILNLETGTCCTYVNAPVADMDGYALIGFSADSTQLATSYIGFSDRTSYAVAGGLLVADAATGATVANLTTKQASASSSLPEGTAFLQPGEWTANGIRFYPSCYACGGVIDSPWYVWNPQTNTVLQTANAWFSIFGDTLDATNELLLNVYNTAFPTAEALGMLPPTNVIRQEGTPSSPRGRRTQVSAAPISVSRTGPSCPPRAVIVVAERGIRWRRPRRPRNAVLRLVAFTMGRMDDRLAAGCHQWAPCIGNWCLVFLWLLKITPLRVTCQLV